MTEDALNFTCTWNMTTDARGIAGDAQASVRIWSLPRGIHTAVIDVAITTDAKTRYDWQFCLEGEGGKECRVRVVESPPPGGSSSATSSTVLVDFKPRSNYTFELWTYDDTAHSVPVAPASFHVKGRFHQLTQEVPSGGHAGTPEDPQLHDAPNDANVSTRDITGAWFDEPYLDDGLIEVGLVVPHIDALHANLGDQTEFALTFQVLAQSWTVVWGTHAFPDTNGQVKDNGWATTLVGGPTAAQRRYIIPSHLELANHTIRTLLPLAAIGSPRSDDLFTNFTATSAKSVVDDRNGAEAGNAGTTIDDTASSRVRDFAIGGPKVWDRLRGVSIAAPAPDASTQAAWTSAPLASKNLPLTLMLAALVAIVATGGAGLLAVRRRLARAPRDPARIAPGALILGKYRVERELGAGGGGRVFLARDLRVDRPVALKLLPHADQAAAAREARSTAAIDHPNVVRVLGIEDVGAQALIVMDFVDGGSLKDRIARSGPLSDVAFARVGDDLLAAVAAVHAAGAVHRDIKPGNVLLTAEGNAKLSDFGIARLPGFETTIGGGAAGSVQYMAPEQARGRRVTERSDLYSAAATLYEARTGYPYVEPRPDESAAEMQMRVAAGAAFDKDIEPPALRAWFARALAPAPEDRFADAREMRGALVDALA